MVLIIDKINIQRIENMLHNKKLLVTCDNWNTFGMPHFVHTMEYFYFATSIILQYNEYLVVIQIPQTE